MFFVSGENYLDENCNLDKVWMNLYVNECLLDEIYLKMIICIWMNINRKY